MDTYFSFSFKGLSGPTWEEFDVRRLILNMERCRVPKDRQKRIINCVEHMHSVGRGRTPLIPKTKLHQLMIDYKNEGNQLYKEDKVNMAKQFYVSSVIVGNMLKDKEYTPIQNQLISTLYCNMAACSNKQEEYRDTVQHCDTALRFNPDNVKAHYRKAAALKNLRNYREAMINALEGQKKAQTSGKESEAQDFQPLITSLQELINNPPPYEPPVNPPRWPDMDRDFLPPRMSNTRARSMFLDNDWMNEGGIREVIASTQSRGTQHTQVSVSQATSNQGQEKKVDESWLEGTNVKLKNKPPPSLNGKSKKKPAKKSVKVNSQSKKKSGQSKPSLRYEYLDGFMDSSSDSNPEEPLDRNSAEVEPEEESEEEEEESEEEMPEEEPIVPIHDPTKKKKVPTATLR